jgi:hypothetical protein
MSVSHLARDEYGYEDVDPLLWLETELSSSSTLGIPKPVTPAAAQPPQTAIAVETNIPGELAPQLYVILSPPRL